VIGTGGDQRTVLVVDDEPDLCEIVRRMLHGRGYQVLTARGVLDAIARCDSHDGRIHLVVTDLRMPDGTGSQLADRVQQTRPETAVLYMSGLPAHTGPVADLTRADATVLAKPFTPAELLAAVDAAITAP
jgi:DNA-binding NtrC family response regulator